ncbi:hypothetical protein QBC45DRAFT_389922 [Copromyces sp. CBS 386.78]|nr:hypothetical protein QBC45DRAFT_389922 [Copromyces sp. CBS 386.78]
MLAPTTTFIQLEEVSMAYTRPSSVDNRPDMPDTGSSNANNETTGTEPVERKDSTNTDTTDACFLYSNAVDSTSG